MLLSSIVADNSKANWCRGPCDLTVQKTVTICKRILIARWTKNFKALEALNDGNRSLLSAQICQMDITPEEITGSYFDLDETPDFIKNWTYKEYINNYWFIIKIIYQL